MNKIVCTCGRQQRINPEHCTLDKAKGVGWTETDGAWRCPRCSGNLEMQQRAFAPPEPPVPPASAAEVTVRRKRRQ